MTSDAARRRLRPLAPVVAGLAAELAASAIPATIEHGDLHGNNIGIGKRRARFFDWGDAVVAHPFQTMTGTRGRTSRRAPYRRRSSPWRRTSGTS